MLFTWSHHITYIDYPWEEDVLSQIWGQKSSAINIEVKIWFPGSSLFRDAISHIWTTHGRKMFPYWIWGQMSSALDIEIEIWFQGSSVLVFPLGDAVSHRWTTHGRKMFPIKFGVKRSSALDIEIEIWFQGFRVTPYRTYGLPMGCKVPKDFIRPFLIHSGKR
jgi:hypothetical protein